MAGNPPKRTALIRCAKELNTTLKLSPKIAATLPTNKLIVELCKVSENFKPTDEFTVETLAALEAIGAYMPGDKMKGEDDEKEEPVKEEAVTKPKTTKTKTTKTKTATKPPKGDDGMEGTKVTKSGSTSKAKTRKPKAAKKVEEVVKEKVVEEKSLPKPKKRRESTIQRDELGYPLGKVKSLIWKTIEGTGPMTMDDIRSAPWNEKHLNQYNPTSQMIEAEHLEKDGKEFKLTEVAISRIAEEVALAEKNSEQDNKQ